MWGLSHLPDSLLQKAYSAKLAFKNTILQRISLTQANIDALEKCNEFFRGLKEHTEAELAMHEEELGTMQIVLKERGINGNDLEF